MGALKYLVLGPLLVEGSNGLTSPGGPTTRSVLASLLIAANRAVSYDRLIEDVWGDEAWDMDTHVLQSHITRLRKVLGKDRVVQIDGSYVLVAESDEVDAVVFERLVEQAVAAPGPEEVRALCKQGFALWRGVPYGDLADREFLRLEVLRLEEKRMEAIEACSAASLALGRHREIVGSLRSAVSEYPFNERLWECYLQALRKSGRPAEALQAFGELEAMLESELEIEPSGQLRKLRESIAAD